MKGTLSLFLLSLLSVSPVWAQASAPDVDYGGAGLTRIHVHGGALTYVWYTGRRDRKTGMPDMRQSLAAYDKYVFQTRLTSAQTAWLDAWVVRDHVSFLRRRYPTTQPGSYGAAFRYTLTVRRGRELRNSTWDDTSHAKPAWTAAQDLKAWCERQRDGRPLSPR